MKLITGLLFFRPIMGLVALSISHSRKMRGGFWWGFFLGIIGIIVVAVRPNDFKEEPIDTDRLEKLANLKEKGALTEEEYEREKSKILRSSKNKDSFMMSLLR